MEIHNKKIQALYNDINEKRKQIIKLKLESPLEEIKNYNFKDKNGDIVSLHSLFGDSEELLLIHSMGKSCSYCTMWADGFRGYANIISDRMPWALTSPDDYSTLKEFSESRNWNYNVLSYHDTSFSLDMGFSYKKDKKEFYWPGVSALIKKDEKIYRTAKDVFGPGDMYNPVWHFFDLFPKGVNGWSPKYKY